jgi:hypothetical protein
MLASLGRDGELGRPMLGCVVEKNRSGSLGLRAGKGRAGRAGLATRGFEDSAQSQFRVQKICFKFSNHFHVANLVEFNSNSNFA